MHVYVVRRAEFTGSLGCEMIARGEATRWTQTLGRAVMALGILASCTAQTTTAFRPSNQSTTASPTGVSGIRDRNNFRDEQEAAPRVNNAPIDP